MFPSMKSDDAVVDLRCGCPEMKQEATCLFCWYPAIGAYRRELHLVSEGHF
jgi:hypothetical protein